MGSITPIPYWQTNIPPTQQTAQCPIYLQNLSAKDISIISTPDSNYQVLSWPTVRRIISDNRLDLFQRKPSDLRRYLEYCYNIKQKYGSVMRYMLDVKLQWKESELIAQDVPFRNEDDFKVSMNDWPYGIDAKIVHLVVWTKFALEDDPETGDTRDDVKREIDRWVDAVFGEKCGGENVIWFRNWRSLKSIHSVEHFHVMLYDPDSNFVRELTKGDISSQEAM
ncbi:1a9f4b13-8765-442a-882a-fa122e4c8120 [Sclerotinia trifoliorum]|uniref:1a9f4b13-8765-442a-882a-fa122e4c8120 n=1 Tax=Sclerotinia trifoliorum TaxID=28548 RepID=A0A8H2W203_9HELO|nr:1a9f4b13-8765-442a-882a-fa122e4c8120 [Sclerotinia trifoliorum]